MDGICGLSTRNLHFVDAVGSQVYLLKIFFSSLVPFLVDSFTPWGVPNLLEYVACERCILQKCGKALQILNKKHKSKELDPSGKKQRWSIRRWDAYPPKSLGVENYLPKQWLCLLTQHNCPKRWRPFQPFYPPLGNYRKHQDQLHIVFLDKIHGIAILLALLTQRGWRSMSVSCLITKTHTSQYVNMCKHV